jgi:regulator-associated protein of mTOR
VTDQGSSSTFAASFADGTVKVFDRRLEEEDAIVRSFSEHAAWVQNVRWHPNLGAQLISARSGTLFFTGLTQMGAHYS